MSNQLKTRNGIPFDFVDGLRIKGVDVTNWDKVFIDQGASYVGFQPIGNLSANNVQLAIQELDNEKVAKTDLAASAGAGSVGFTPTGNLASVTVQSALAELDSEKVDSVNLSGASGAANVGFTPTGGVASTTVQAAIAELDNEKANNTSLAAAGGAGNIGFTPSGNISATNVQAALVELDNEKAPINSPALTGGPTSPTPPQFDNDTSIATTEFVQRAIGNYRAHSQISAATTLVVADAGKIYRILGTGFSVTMPAPSDVTAGQAFHFYTPFPSDSCTITTPTGVIHIGKTANNSQTMLGNQFWTLISNGTLYTVQICSFYNGIGDNQTWQDMTATRLLGTNYTNSTGRSIMVQVRSYTNGNVCAGTVDGLLLAGASLSSTDGYPSVTFIVPPGSTYSFQSTSLSRWVELR